MGRLCRWIWEAQERILAWTEPYIQCLTSAAPRRELRVLYRCLINTVSNAINGLHKIISLTSEMSQLAQH